jgi:hypothetical protein
MVRRVDDGRGLQEETILRIECSESVSEETIRRHLDEALHKLVE